MFSRKEQVIMSIDYIILFPIPMSELFGDRLKKYGIHDAQLPKSADDARCLTDGENNYLWAYGNPAMVLTHYVPNGLPDFILQAIATEFDVRIYSEHELDSGERVERPKPGYVPLDTPTDEAIALIRAKWRAVCEAFDEELKKCFVLWEGKEIPKEA
jgi:hypothetical protein